MYSFMIKWLIVILFCVLYVSSSSLHHECSNSRHLKHKSGYSYRVLAFISVKHPNQFAIISEKTQQSFSWLFTSPFFFTNSEQTSFLFLLYCYFEFVFNPKNSGIIHVFSRCSLELLVNQNSNFWVKLSKVNNILISVS